MGKTKTTATHPQQSEEGEPTLQDDGLWRKLLTRAQKGTTNHGFFVIVVVEGSMHTSMFCKLGLPTGFMDHHCKSLNEHIILEGPDGHQWPTMLGLQWDSQPCLMHGWKEFAAGYNLEIKDQVVFLLFEDSHFLVQVYDANNNIKKRVSASQSEKVGRHAEAKNVSQAGAQQRVEDVVEKKNYAGTLQVQPQRQGTKNPLLYFDTESVDLGIHRPARRVNHAHPAHHADFKTSYMENIVHIILDSSDEEDDPVPLKHREAWDDDTKPNIKIGGNHSNRMTLRSAKLFNNKNSLEEVDTEDHSQATQIEDVGVLVEKDETEPSSRSPASAISAPSSPEPVTVLKRSRRLQQKTGDYEGDELGRANRVVRSRKLYKLSQETEASLREDENYEPAFETPATKLKVKQVVAGSEVLTSCCSTQQSTMKRERCRFQQLQESTSKITQGANKVVVWDATQSAAADVETTETVMPQELAAPEMPGELLGGRSIVKTRQKVKSCRDWGKKRTGEKWVACPPEEEAKAAYKRPARIAPATKALNLIYVSRRRPVTPRERQNTLEAAQAYAHKSTNKHYVMQLRTSQVYCGFHLGVSSEFADALQLPFSRLKVTLYDMTGKTWEVEWLGDHPKHPGLASAGWVKFVLEHLIEEGDVCVFELLDSEVFNISVAIFRIVPLVEPPEQHGWRRHYNIPSTFGTRSTSPRSIGTCLCRKHRLVANHP